jgi:hypothetical protein
MKSPKSAASRTSLRFLPTPRDRLILETVRIHGRLTAGQIRRLIFRKKDGSLVSTQAVNLRLRKLVSNLYLHPVVVDSGVGSGPYAYGLGLRGAALFASAGSRRGRGGGVESVWHSLEVAEFRIQLQGKLEANGGALVEWIGEPALRSVLVGRSGWPIPDALVHWRLPGREGAFLLEWDRGSETLATVVLKLRRYANYWRQRGHKELVPGLGLRTRLAMVLGSRERRDRLVRWLLEHPGAALHTTILIGHAEPVQANPLGPTWWRSDTRSSGALTD